MYVDPNFKTKKALKDAVASGQQVILFSNSVFPESTENRKGAAVEGPHFPEPHKWYAQVDTDETGKVVKVK
jgi:hypothetical protein